MDGSGMTDKSISDSAVDSAPSRSAGRLMIGTALCFVAAGALLWLREGERLFTDGLIAAIARCF
jgi:uncharacterized membrane protein YhhN